MPSAVFEHEFFDMVMYSVPRALFRRRDVDHGSCELGELFIGIRLFGAREPAISTLCVAERATRLVPELGDPFARPKLIPARNAKLRPLRCRFPERL
jgi:hypothetical protein